jgi:putative transposase
MGIARSTYYDTPEAKRDDTALVEAMAAICAEFEAYGWRRVQAALRHQGIIANHKKIKRLMREHDLQPRTRRRFARTTDSDHDQPIFPDRTRELIVDAQTSCGWPTSPTSPSRSASFIWR